MIERIVLSALLAASVMGNGWQWWTGMQRFDEGRMAERLAWNAVIEDRNRQIGQLAGELTSIYEADEVRRKALLEALAGRVLQPLPVEMVAQCSIPEATRLELSAIRAGGVP